MKIKNQHVYLKDDKKVIFGTGDDAEIFWSGSELEVTTTLSGVTATEDYHLVRKDYVDAEAGADIVTYENLDANGDVGTGAAQVAQGSVAEANTVFIAGIKTGREALTTDDAEEAVVFGAAFADTDYTVVITFVNTTDSPASVYSATVTAQETTGFTATFSGDIDTDNYTMHWIAIHD